MYISQSEIACNNRAELLGLKSPKQRSDDCKQQPWPRGTGAVSEVDSVVVVPGVARCGCSDLVVYAGQTS